MAARLYEIKRRKGKKVVLRVRLDNERSINIAEHFGFKKIEEGKTNEWTFMVLDDIRNSETIKKIERAIG